MTQNKNGNEPWSDLAHNPWRAVQHVPGLHVLWGENGCGKTTWLKQLAHEWAPVYYSGHKLGWVEHLTVQKNLSLWNKVYKGQADGPKQKANTGQKTNTNETNKNHTTNADIPSADIPNAHILSAHMLDSHIHTLLQPHLNKRFGELSRGQQQFVSCLGAQLSGMNTWLFDEPFAHMDETHANWAASVFETHVCRGGCLVITSHTAEVVPLHALLQESTQTGRFTQHCAIQNITQTCTPVTLTSV